MSIVNEQKGEAFLNSLIEKILQPQQDEYAEFNQRIAEDGFILLDSEILLNAPAKQFAGLAHLNPSDTDTFSVCVTTSNDLICALYRMSHRGEFSDFQILINPVKIADLPNGSFQFFRLVDAEVAKDFHKDVPQYNHCYSSIAFNVLRMQPEQIEDLIQQDQSQHITLIQKLIQIWKQAQPQQTEV